MMPWLLGGAAKEKYSHEDLYLAPYDLMGWGAVSVQVFC